MLKQGRGNSGQFSRNPEILDATGFSGDGTLLTFGTLSFVGRSDTPADPPADNALMWYDKTNARLCIKMTDSDGVTTTDHIAPMVGTTENGTKVNVRVTNDGKLMVEEFEMADLLAQLKRLVFMMHVAFDVPYAGSENEV